MKKKLMHRFDVVKWSRIILSEPLYLTLFIAFFMGISVVFVSWGVYEAQWRNFKLQMVGELHGIVIDVIVMAVLIVLINRVSERKRSIEFYKEEIDDLRFRLDVEDMQTRVHAMRRWHDTEYMRLKILKAIKALTRNHVNEIVLDHVNFSHGNFHSINLRKSDMSRSIAIGVILKNANLSLTKLCSADFSESNMEGINLRGAKANNTNFADAILVGADCSQSTFIHARLNNAELSKANFRESNLTGADLTGAKLFMTDFRFVKGLKVEQVIKARIRMHCKFDPQLEKEIAEYDERFKSRAAVLLSVPSLPAAELQMQG